MTLKTKYLSIGALSVLLFVLIFATFYTAKANPSYFSRFQVAAATTTVAYLVPGTSTATSTLPIDLGVNGSQGADSSAFLVQFTGSSTASILNITFEYSQGGNGADCVATPTSCDWYKDSLFGANIATTTTNVDLDIANNYQLTFASTTVGNQLGNATRTTRIIELSTPTRFIRAILTLSPGSFNGAAWFEFITKRQSN